MIWISSISNLDYLRVPSRMRFVVSFEIGTVTEKHVKAHLQRWWALLWARSSSARRVSSKQSMISWMNLITISRNATSRHGIWWSEMTNHPQMTGKKHTNRSLNDFSQHIPTIFQTRFQAIFQRIFQRIFLTAFGSRSYPFIEIRIMFLVRTPKDLHPGRWDQEQAGRCRGCPQENLHASPERCGSSFCAYSIHSMYLGSCQDIQDVSSMT